MSGRSPHEDRDAADGTGLTALLQAGIERVERDGPGALDALCREHPEQAGALRARFDALARVGLLHAARRIGRYRVVRTLGRGGMGVVHLAHDEQMDRLVALKVLDARLADSERATLRFQREIATVARLRHPAIVPVYDAGTHDGGPFFTMEFVAGRSLAEILDDLRRRGERPDRLDGPALTGTDGAGSWVMAACRLALDVAEGLDHAHREGAIHRDVKPDNVIVGEDGRARLLDFGLARLVGDPSVTSTGEFAGTPYYAAPEQVGDAEGVVDARTDVHGVGALLYEMLTLERPFTGRNAADVMRRIALEDPVAPRRLQPSVPRDVDTVCMTALEKQPERRYATAAALADDLRRLLEGRPVRARPVGAATRTVRFARRRPALATASILALAVVVGTPVGLWRTNVAIRAERDRADSEWKRAEAAAADARAALRAEREAAARADTATRFLDDWTHRAARIDEYIFATLAGSDPRVDDRAVSIAGVLRRAAALAGPTFADDPRLAAEIHLHLATSFFQLGLYDEAIAQYAATWETAQRAAGPDEAVVAAMRYQALRDGSAALLRAGRPEEAEQAALAALTLGRVVKSEDDPDLIDVLTGLGRARWDQGDETGARAVYRRVLASRLDTLPEDDPRVAKALTNYASSLPESERELAIRLLGRAVELQRRHQPSDDFEAAMQHVNRLWYGFYGEPPSDEDITGLRHAIDIYRSRLGPDADSVANATALLAVLLSRRDDHDPDEVRALHEEANDILRRIGPGDPRRVAMLMWHADYLRDRGRPDDALPVLLESIGIRRDIPDPAKTPTLDALVAKLILLLRDIGRDADAEQLAAENPGAAALLEPASDSEGTDGAEPPGEAADDGEGRRTAGGGAPASGR